MVSPHWDVAWLVPHRWCWVPVAAKVTSSDASPLRKTGSPTWQWRAMAAPHGHVPFGHGSRGGDHRGSRLRAPDTSFRPHGTPIRCFHHWSAIAQSSGCLALPRHQTTNLPFHQPPRNYWVVEGMRRLPRRVGGPHHLVVWQSSHLAAVPLEQPDFAAAHAKAPPIHLMLPKEQATLLVPNEGGVLEPHMPSMRAL